MDVTAKVLKEFDKRTNLTEEQCKPTGKTLDDSSKEDLLSRGLNRTADALDMGEQLRLCHRSYGVNDLTCMKPKGHKGRHGK